MRRDMVRLGGGPMRPRDHSPRRRPRSQATDRRDDRENERGHRDISPDRPLCLNLLAERYAQEENRQRQFQNELERLTRRLDDGVMRNTHPALQRWLSTGDNAASSCTGWFQKQPIDTRAPPSSPASEPLDSPQLLWELKRPLPSSVPCLATTTKADSCKGQCDARNWMDTAACGLCVEDSGNLLWHQGRHLTRSIPPQRISHGGPSWLSLLGFSNPMLVECGVAVGGRVCTDAHGHEGRHSITEAAEKLQVFKTHTQSEQGDKTAVLPLSPANRVSPEQGEPPDEAAGTVEVDLASSTTAPLLVGIAQKS
jgi:hypothetical protein